MPTFFDVRGFSHIFSHNNMEFAVHEVDESSNPRYYGYVSHIGSWIIMRLNTTTGQHRYATGKINFATNWTNKATLTYKYIDGTA
jgi:hypothetical protein